MRTRFARNSFLLFLGIGLTRCDSDPARPLIPAEPRVLSENAGRADTLENDDSPDTLPDANSKGVDGVEESAGEAVLPDASLRTKCPQAPRNVDLAAVVPYNTANASQKIVGDYLTLMKKQPPFDNGKTKLPFWLFLPDKASASNKLPLVIYLHGGGEIGDNNGQHLENRAALPFFASKNSLLTPENRVKYPAFIVAPQCNCTFGSNEWSAQGNGPFPYLEKPSGYGQSLLDLIEYLAKTYAIDRKRIYVTGISMGGGGVWDMAARRPDLFAAAVAVAGHPLIKSDAKVLAASKIPIWAHHAEGDAINPTADTEASVKAVAAAGGCAFLSKYPKKTNYKDIDPGGGEGPYLYHTVWMRAYLNSALWEWVFAQKMP